MSALIWNNKHLKNFKVTRLLGMIFESGTPREKGLKKTQLLRKFHDFFIIHCHNIGVFEYEGFIKISLLIAKLLTF